MKSQHQEMWQPGIPWRRPPLENCIEASCVVSSSDGGLPPRPGLHLALSNHAEVCPFQRAHLPAITIPVAGEQWGVKHFLPSSKTGKRPGLCVGVGGRRGGRAEQPRLSQRH